MTVKEIAKMIDHTVLSNTATHETFVEACEFAKANECASVCICPFFVAECAKLLKGSEVKTCTVIGFPHGTHSTAAKVAEAKAAIADGADELDMVVNVSKVKDGDWGYVKTDIAAVTLVSHAAGASVKVIFENCFLTDDEKKQLCQICSEVGVDFVKTSTGFGTSGAIADDVRLMRENSKPEIQVKAAGGIRTLDQLLEMYEAGATRMGCSRSAAVLEEAKKRFGV